MTADQPHTALRGPVPLAHLLLCSHVRPGDHTADATCGNGNDTLLLAKLVGPAGHVLALDLQQQALDTTRDLLTAAGVAERVSIVPAGHETIGGLARGPLNAVVFNLGYLPGGDRSLTTRPETTCRALEQSLQLLAPGGLLLVTLYPGHDNGSEAAAVTAWAADLDQRQHHVWRMGQVNVSASAPYLLLLQAAL